MHHHWRRVASHRTKVAHVNMFGLRQAWRGTIAQARCISELLSYSGLRGGQASQCLNQLFQTTPAPCACDKDCDEDGLWKAIQDARSKAPQKSRPRRSPRIQNCKGEFECYGCGLYLPAEAFPPSQWLPGYCLDCVSLRGYDYRSTLRGAVRKIVSSARYRTSRSPKRGLICTITADDVLDMLWAQQGRCYYSEVPMNYFQPNSHWRLSCERLHNHVGYTLGNCVLVAAEFNTPDLSTHALPSTPISGSAQWSKSKVQQVTPLRTSSVDLDVLTRLVQEARGVTNRRRNPRVRRSDRPRVLNSLGELECSSCLACKPSDCFRRSSKRPLGLASVCKDCARGYHQRYADTLRGTVVQKLSSAAQRARKRGLPCDLTLDGLLDKLLEQQARCHYSGVPMALTRYSDWRLSLERLRNSEGYTMQNCVWVANEFNTPDNSINKAKFPVYGTAQWSKAKVEFVWGEF